MTDMKDRPLETGGMAYAPVGIGGWLILPPIHLLIDVFNLGFTIWTGLHRTNPSVATGSGSPSNLSLAASVGLLFYSALVCIYAIYCLFPFFKKKANTPNLMMTFYVLMAAKWLANLSLVYLLPVEHFSEQQQWDAVRQAIQAAVGSGIWIAYFKSSVRVKNTFVN